MRSVNQRLVLKALALWAVNVLAFQPPSLAANITHARIGEVGELILIEGEISQGDEKTFQNLAVQYPRAVIALNSPGGLIAPSLEIGKLIRIREFVTVVTGGNDCVSSCALIWLAGSKRFLSRNGRVGFHASYLEKDGRYEETGLGNALVGHYLSTLNLSQSAVIFATKAAPSQIKWLNRSNQPTSGIEFEDFDDDDDSGTTAPSKAATTPPSVQSPPTHRSGPDWRIAAIGNESVMFVDASSVRREGNIAQFWVQAHYLTDAYGSNRFTALRVADCDAKTYRDLTTTFFNGEKVQRTTGKDVEIQYAAPGTIGSGIVIAACTADYETDTIEGDLAGVAQRILKR